MHSTLTVAIPALNEEESIGNTIERRLAAREQIKQAAGHKKSVPPCC